MKKQQEEDKMTKQFELMKTLESYGNTEVGGQ